MSDRPAHDDERCATGDECFRCHIRGVNVGLPRDFATRTYSKAMPRGSDPAWERGIATSKRPNGTEMPYLKADGSEMGVKEFAQKRHLIRENTIRAQSVPV